MEEKSKKGVFFKLSYFDNSKVKATDDSAENNETMERRRWIDRDKGSEFQLYTFFSCSSHFHGVKTWCFQHSYCIHHFHLPQYTDIHRDLIQSHLSRFSPCTLLFIWCFYLFKFSFQTKKTLQLQCILYSTHLHRIFHSKHQDTPRAMLVKLLCEFPSMLVNYCKVIHVPLNVCFCRYFGVFLLAGPSHFKISEKKER